MGSSMTAVWHTLMLLAIPVCVVLLVILLVVYFGQWRAYKASLPDDAAHRAHAARAGSRGSRRQGKRA